MVIGTSILKNAVFNSVSEFMVNIHQINSIKDAKDYVKRIKAVRPLMKQLISQLELREKMGITPPAFVYDSVIKTCETLISGYPFNKNKKSTPNILWSNFDEKKN